MTMRLIQTVVVGAAGASSINFNYIPQTFTDLQLNMSLRTNSTLTYSSALMRFNGSISNYTYRFLQGTGSAVGNQINTLGAHTGDAAVSSYTANTFSNMTVTIPNAFSLGPKSYYSDSVSENNATAALSLIISGVWNDSRPITSISISDFDNFVYSEFSSASLYGITKGSDGITNAFTSILFFAFTTGVENWTTNSGSVSASDGIMTFAQTGSDPHLISPVVSFAGSVGRFVNIRLRKVSTTPFASWDGVVYYSTSGHSFSASFFKQYTQPTWTGDYQTIRLDMSVLNAGGSDWTNNMITQVRFDFALGAADSLLIDSIWFD
jgi:hypothetical protein